MPDAESALTCRMRSQHWKHRLHEHCDMFGAFSLIIGVVKVDGGR